MLTSIYALFYLENGIKKYFYVGRSKDVSRRVRQHRYAKRQGHEDKYYKIRELETMRIEWLSEIVETVQDSDHYPDAEQWHVIRLTREGHDLTNMRHGSIEHRKQLAEQVSDRQIRSAADVRQDRYRRAERKRASMPFRESAGLRERIRRGELSTREERILLKILRRGIPDVATDTTLPKHYREALIARMNARGDTGMYFPGDRRWDIEGFHRFCFNWTLESMQRMKELEEEIFKIPLPISGQCSVL